MTLPSWLQAIVLGLIQGITEFLPVSSSGHLSIAPYLFRLQQPTLAFGVLLHLATLMAVLAYFRHDLVFLAKGTLGLSTLPAEDHKRARMTVTLLAIGSVPAAAAGLALQSLIGDIFEDPRIAAGFLLVTAGLLLFAERLRTKRAAAKFGEAEAAADPTLDDGRDEGTVTIKDAVIIGCAQALAILPGISRAGATMATGMVRGLTRTAAARFSFLLSIPVIAGAAVLELSSLEADAFGAYSNSDAALASLAAGLSGYWAIRFLLKLVSADDLRGFARYLIIVSVLVLVGSIWLGPPDSLAL